MNIRTTENNDKRPSHLVCLCFLGSHGRILKSRLDKQHQSSKTPRCVRKCALGRQSPVTQQRCLAEACCILGLWMMLFHHQMALFALQAKIPFYHEMASPQEVTLLCVCVCVCRVGRQVAGTVRRALRLELVLPLVAVREPRLVSPPSATREEAARRSRGADIRLPTPVSTNCFELRSPLHVGGQHSWRGGR